MEITGKAIKLYKDLVYSGYAITELPYDLNKTLYKDSTSYGYDITEEHVFELPYNLNEKLREAYTDGYFDIDFFKKYADVLIVEITTDSLDQEKIKEYAEVLSKGFIRRRCEDYIAPHINVLVIRKHPDKDFEKAEKIRCPMKLFSFLYLFKKRHKHPIYSNKFSLDSLFYIEDIDLDDLEEEIKIELDPATDHGVRSEFRSSLEELYKEWYLPYLKSSKEDKNVNIINIERRLCNFLYLLKKYSAHPMYTKGFGMRDLFYIENINPENLEKEIKMELDYNNNYGHYSKFRNSLKELYKEWKDALNKS